LPIVNEDLDIPNHKHKVLRVALHQIFLEATVDLLIHRDVVDAVHHSELLLEFLDVLVHRVVLRFIGFEILERHASPILARNILIFC
jgi:hypothetical protein